MTKRLPEGHLYFWKAILDNYGFLNYNQDGSTGGVWEGGEHPPTGVQTQVGGCWGREKFLQKCVRKTKVLLKNKEKS